MLNTVRDTLKKYGMLNGVTEVTVALSGGADSVALLCCLEVLSDELGIKLYAAHLNHSLRGEESDADETFVRELCRQKNIPLFCEKADVRKFSIESGKSTELAAREVRYEFLKRVSKGVIATAHTASDNIETVLFNLARGTGVAGLCGIPPKRDNLIRPLIKVTRAEVERYCLENGLKYRTDSTNSDQAYSRNRIRHSVVPQLSKINSEAVKNTSKMTEDLREVMDYLNLQAAECLKKAKLAEGLSVEVLNTAHTAVKARCVSLAYAQAVGKIPEHIHVEAVLRLLETDFGKVSVQNGFSALVKNRVLYFVPEKTQCLPETAVESFPFDAGNLKLLLLSEEKQKFPPKFNNLLLNNVLDYDRICGKLVLRGRKPGDKICLLKRNCTKSFKNLFNEAKIPEHKRDRLWVLADDSGVIWLQGFGIDKRVQIQGNAKNILLISCFEG